MVLDQQTQLLQPGIHGHQNPPQRIATFPVRQPAGAIRQGQKALAENQPALAETWMRKAAAWDPSAVPLYMLGRVLHQNEKSTEAEAVFLQAAALDPANPEYPYTLALLYGEMGRLQEAVTQFQKAVQIEPDFGRAWYNLGLAHAGLDQLDRAVAALKEAESRMQDSADVPYALYTIYLRMGRDADAREAAARARAFQPDS